MKFLSLALFLSASLLQTAPVEVPLIPPPVGGARRVVSMSPHYTSILYDMGAQDSLVGVTDFCRYPPEARSKPRVGGFLDPHIERVLQLRPDLVLMVRAHGVKAESLKKLGLNVQVMGNDSLSELWKAYDLLGKLLQRRRAAETAQKRLKARLEAVRRSAGKRTRTVLLIVGKDPGRLTNLYAVGPGTFADEVMRLAGLRNILADSKIKYPIVSKEMVLRRDPDLIIQMPPEGKESDKLAIRELDSWKSWQELRAVREGRVYMVPDPGMLVPGPGTGDLAEWLAKIAR